MQFDREIDLKGEECPMPFVRSKLELEEMELGQVLRVIVDYSPAVDNVPKSLEIQGEKVLSVNKINDTDWEIIVKKTYEPGN
ncbi:sulfurtransferase TusA family protein [Metallumcola ferriviriculae]|uniref:Sulfurtransferase TusA family protein n=1 Tax=Metallumcola ferriviriculae TaxID=3039180 RepID=A0AAU0UN63_9FIRM|nr:sulfurtransferase TusA family protein [Desulfitibacteraceae bacterium MK1]